MAEAIVAAAAGEPHGELSLNGAVVDTRFLSHRITPT
jgi:hypothetical protein